MVIKCDFLVIGGGAAAGKAALEAYENGATVMMAMKGAFGTSGASAYQIAEILGYNAADGEADSEDSPAVHYEDIMRAAAGMADSKLAKIVAYEAIESLRDLEKLDIPFHKTEEGKYLEVLGCFATKPRMHLVPGHAEPIVRAQKQAIQEKKIEVFEWTIITKLLTEENRVVGAMGINKNGEIVIFESKAVFLGTGGAGQLFSYNINPSDITGDGYSLGFHAGAELKNMEFMQAGPGLIHPCKNMFNSWLWAVHPKLTNGNGEEFLSNYLPVGMTAERCMDLRSGHYPFSNYDGSHWIDIAIQTEIKDGRSGSHGGIIADFTEINLDNLPKNSRGNEIRESWHITNEWLKENRGLDLTKTPVEIAILGHAINGGLCINEDGLTTIQGLYAAGETTSGPHGADRLGGNMVLTCQIFGKRAGRAAANYIREVDSTTLPIYQIESEQDRLQQLKNKRGTVKPHHLKKELQSIMWRNVLVTRTEESLNTALNGIKKLQKKFQEEVSVTNNKELLHAMEAENLMLIGEVITRAARLRKETRGSHCRLDFPERDDENYLFNILMKLNGDKITHRTISADPENVRRYPYEIAHA